MPAIPFRRLLMADLHVAALLGFFVGLPSAVTAQTIVAIAPQQCVWHAGDNLAWAAPNLYESGWQPYSAWTANTAEPHLRVRCHADLNSLPSFAQPAIQVTLYSAYQLYLNGVPSAAWLNLRSCSAPVMRLFSMRFVLAPSSPVPHNTLWPPSTLVSLASSP